MIIDRINFAGLDAYFQDPDNPGKVNIAPFGPITIRTAPLSKGKQVEISGLQLLIEAEDLNSFFQFQIDGGGAPAPLMKISVMKEMFAGLFADPFRHRVYNLAGSLDFNDGILTNGKVQEIDGIPTIVSTGREECKWVSKKYILPDPITIDSVAWELATSKLSPADSFEYKIEIECRDAEGTEIGNISTGMQFIKADQQRFKEKIIENVKSFQITFRAKVGQDSFLTERQLPSFNEKTGRPLLRAINILELINSSVYDIHSLTELQTLCSDYKISETPGPEITRLIATLNLNAVLVNSEREDIESNKYEFVELSLLTDKFSKFESKRIEEILFRILN